MNYLKKITLVLMASLLVWSPCSAMKTSEMTENTAVNELDWLITTDSAYTTTKKATTKTVYEGVAESKAQYFSGGDLAAKVAALGATVCELIVDQDESLVADLSIPENILVTRTNGSIITIATGCTLTIARLGAVGDTQLFAGAGAVELPNTTGVSAGLFLTSGQPDGTTSNATEVQKAINALPALGGLVTLPMNANRYRFNVVVPDNVRLEGVAPHATKVGPYVNADPVVAVTGARVHARYLYFYGAGAGTSVYGIRHDRALDGSGGGLQVEHCRFYGFTQGININNNYYNNINNNTFSSVTYGIYGRNAFNRNTIRDNKFSAYEYGVAILYDGGTDAYPSHGNTTQDNAFESPSTGGIGILYGNSGGNVSIHDYFEGHVAASGYPIMEAGGPVYGWHTGAGNEAFLVDSWGRDFTKLGVTVGTTVYNRKDGSSATVATITNGSATNDKLTMTLAGGSENDWDVDDYFVIDINSNEYITLDVAPATDWAAGDVITGQSSGKTSTVVQKISTLEYQIRDRSGAYTLGEVIGVTGTAEKLADQGAANPTTNKISTSRLGNKFMSPEFSAIAESDKFVQGMNQISSGLIGTWGGYKTGENVIATSTTDFAYTANTWKTLTLSETSYFRYPTSMVRISYKFINGAASPATLTFRPKNGGAADAFHQIDVGASATVSGTLDVPLLDNESFSVVADQNGTLSIRIHKFLN